MSSSRSFEDKLVDVRGDMDLVGLLEALNSVQINYRLDQNLEPEELSLDKRFQVFSVEASVAAIIPNLCSVGGLSLFAIQ